MLATMTCPDIIPLHVNFAKDNEHLPGQKSQSRVCDGPIRRWEGGNCVLLNIHDPFGTELSDPKIKLNYGILDYLLVSTSL